jgi:NADH-quinone oxidoreductase subunit H
LMILVFWGNFNSLLELFWKLTVINFIFISIRAAYPRVRYDQLLFYAWKYLFPLSFILIFWNIILSRYILLF